MKINGTTGVSGGAKTWIDGGLFFLMNKKLKLIKKLKNN